MASVGAEGHTESLLMVTQGGAPGSLRMGQPQTGQAGKGLGRAAPGADVC